MSQSVIAEAVAPNEAHVWIAEEWLAKKTGEKFTRQRIKLAPGGAYTFHAVSEDGKKVGTIISATASGKNAATKLNKVRSDFYYLLIAKAEFRLALFTDRGMYELVQKEVKEGRVPTEIQILYVTGIPKELQALLQPANPGLTS